MAVDGTKTVGLANMNELSDDATLIAIENALNGALTGSSASDKGYGVRQERDADGKLVEVVVFFDEKVPQGERAAAIDAIERNSGVAAVQPRDYSEADGFDTYANGSLIQVSVPGWTRAASFAAEVVVSDDQSVSAPHSAKLDMTVAEPNATAAKFARLERRNLDQGASAPIASESREMRLYLPSDLGTNNNGLSGAFPIDVFVLTSYPWLFKFDTVTDDAGISSIPLTLARFKNTDPAEALTLSLPLDDAWHTVKMAWAYGTGGTPTVTLSIDATSQTFTYPGVDPNVLSNSIINVAGVTYISNAGTLQNKVAYIDNWKLDRVYL